MRSVVRDNGEVVIPREIRDQLGIGPGQVLDFEEQDGRLVGVKVDEGPGLAMRDEAPLDGVAPRGEAGTYEYEQRLRGLAGALRGHGSTDEIMEMLRGPRDLA
jgi:AbrB family looped-hinge helix DNA binding protein